MSVFNWRGQPSIGKQLGRAPAAPKTLASIVYGNTPAHALRNATSSIAGPEKFKQKVRAL